MLVVLPGINRLNTVGTNPHIYTWEKYA